MLGNYYRWQVYNGTGVTVTVTITAILWKFDSSGALSFSTEQQPINASGITTLAYGESSGVNNATDKYIGAQISAKFDPGASSATGAVTLYLQQSTDGGTTWSGDESATGDGNGLVVGSHYLNAASNFVIKNFEV